MISNQQFLSKIKGFKLEGWIKKVWKQMPAEARKVLLDFWTKKELKFEMIPDFSKTYKKRHGCKYVAASTNLRRFSYSKRMFNEINETAGLAVIAHEFGHVYRGALGLEDANLARYKIVREGFDAEEVLVDKTIIKWGFDARAVDIFFELFKIKHDPKARANFEKLVKTEVDRQLAHFRLNIVKEMAKLSA